MFYYVYILQSEKDKNFYIGFTTNLKNRLKDHNMGRNTSTTYLFEGYINKKCIRERKILKIRKWNEIYKKAIAH